MADAMHPGGPAAPGGAHGLDAGRVIAGRYRVDAWLAEGGMGQVYRAHDLELDVPIALKTIHPAIASDPASLRRFKQEVLLARSVTHVHVCRIFDLWRDDASGTWFLTMEFLPGETLAARIRRTGRVPGDESLAILRQLAGALDAAHRAGIVHRDFKSSNVMLVPAGGGTRAVITDFGLAVATRQAARVEDLAPAAPAASRADADATIDSAGPGGGIVGTPAYMSPEQVRGEAVGPASDLYALGVVLYEMCTGRLPFEGPTPLETAFAHLAGEPPRPATRAPVDDAWDRAIVRLLAKRPGDRFATARDVVLAIEGGASPADRSGADGADATLVAPPPKPTASRYRLPAERDAFVGRGQELDAMASRLGPSGPARTRLLTVLGPGGTGKTRLVLRYAWEHLDDWPGGIWFCDLSETRSADAVMSAVAAVLEVPVGRGDAMNQLVHAIEGRGRCLIILDNFEQVVEQAAAMLGRWLGSTSEAAFLVTSQERLQLAAEATYSLEPLAPATDAVELFAIRAAAHRPGFHVDDSNRALVEEIVRRLDGLPLAIELAAARLRVLGLEQLAARLADRFRLLAGGARGRHSTLRTALDWSWELLAPWEQSAMAQLSVFEGGFTLEAAEEVVDLSAFEEAPFTLDVVQSLADKSWLRTRVERGAPRLGTYVTVQEYAAGRLGAMEGVGAEAEARHGRCFAALGTEAALQSLDRHGGGGRRAALALEIDNLVAACRRAIARGDEPVIDCACAAAVTVFELRGPASAGLALSRDAVAALRTPAFLVRALLCMGSAERFSGRLDDAYRTYERALGMCRGMGNRRGEGSVLGNLGVLAFERGRMDEARERLEAALAVHREVGNRRDEGFVMGILGSFHQHQGRMDAARELHEGALAIHRELGNRRLEGTVLGNLGMLLNDQGRIGESLSHYEASLAIHRELGNRRFEGLVLGNLGVLHQNEGHHDEARAHYEAALTIHREVGDRAIEGTVVGNIGDLCATLGRWAEAREHAERARAIHREVGNRRGEALVLGNLAEVLAREGRREEARTCLEEEIAVLREVQDRLELGKALAAMGELVAVDDPAAARALLEEAAGIAAALGAGPESDLARKVARLGGTLAS